ncbi:MAG TPA: hypothetical protein VNA89_07095 [Gemmatimonadaceae bacterium]|nr:hypothetical protein [Gemmatimonadaceae bacterium]
MEQPRRPEPTLAPPSAPTAAIVPDPVQSAVKAPRRAGARKIDCGEHAATRAKPRRKDTMAGAQVCDAHAAADRRKGPGH